METGELQRRLGQNLRALRESQGLSQEEFAAEVSGFHRTHQSAVERGKENMSLQAIERLAQRVGVDPLDLLKKPDDPAT